MEKIQLFKPFAGSQKPVSIYLLAGQNVSNFFKGSTKKMRKTKRLSSVGVKLNLLVPIKNMYV